MASGRVRLAALLAVAVWAAGCTPASTTRSATPSVPSAPSTSTTAGPPSSDSCGIVPTPGVVVHGTVGRCSVTATLGVTFRIVLSPGFTWQDPVSDSPAVTVTDVVRQVSGQLEASLTARRSGTATVSSAGAVQCPPGQPCPAPARLWRLLVAVTA